MRPQILNFDAATAVFAEISLKQDCFNDENDLVDILIMPTLIKSSIDPLTGEVPVPIDDIMFNKELGIKFNGYTYGVGKLVRLAEINYDTLHLFIKKYFDKNDLESFYSRNADCAKTRVYEIEKKLDTLTYGNLRNILSAIIKTDSSFNSIDDLNDSSKRKEFTKSYTEYIEDRDRFTHGKLFFLYPKNTPVLRIKDNGTDQYITYSKEIFISNLKKFRYLENVVSEMTNILE